MIYTLKQSGLIENEALYNLKLEVIENSPLQFFPDQRIVDDAGKCGAKQINFKKGSSYSFEFDIEAPYFITFKNLVNTYGVSDNENKADALSMYIYSDYLKKSVKVPQFLIRDDELVKF